MKTYISTINVIGCIVCIQAFSFAQFTDDFSDGDFTGNPAWTGDKSHFEINEAGQLHLLSAGTDTSLLFTRSSRIRNTEWCFWMKMSFNTSVNNHARIYLAADTTDPAFMSSCYYIQVGGSDDSVSIMRQTGDLPEKMFTFRSYRTSHSTNAMRFDILCDDAGNWTAKIDTAGGFSYYTEGTFHDDSIPDCRWFGLMCRYTSSNALKFYFDDFYVGPMRRDTVPPAVSSAKALSAGIIRLTFSETVQKQAAQDPAHYIQHSSSASPDSVFLDIMRPDRVFIYLHDSLREGQPDSLHIRGIPDLSGNLVGDTVVAILFYQPRAFDVVINEILADPDPPEGLPDGEFAELYNRSAFPIDLEGWTFHFGSYFKGFPARVVPPGGYSIIAGNSGYQPYGNCDLILTSSSSLSNEGSTLVLKDSRGHVIHSVSYSYEWYRGSFKGDGGWSLEMADPANPCGCRDNWAASRDQAGGTPGFVNSIRRENPDEIPPFLLRAYPADSTTIIAVFSEAMDSLSMLDTACWSTHPDRVGDPDGVHHPVGVSATPPDFRTALLFFNEPFPDSTEYLLKITGRQRDCAGNPADSSRFARFAMPDPVAVHDVVINELLSDPASGGSRFVELYNRSEKVVDLKTLVLSDREETFETEEDAMPLTSDGWLLFPGEYIALAADAADICDRYHPAFPEKVERMEGFPVYGDDTGTVVLARKHDLAVIDIVRYEPGMHYPLLATSEGVSLERCSPEMPSNDPGNWNSAAETAGFATPGQQNSHRIAPEEPGGGIRISPEIFSPDNDGRDDLLIISVGGNEPDLSVNITIFDVAGRFIRQVANNVLAGSEGVFTWDGMTESRKKAPMGFYILLVELTRPDGTFRKFKKIAILGGKR
jgi:hypothetical protein